MSPVRTTCPYCGVGCGVVAEHGPQGLTLRGDEQHPANRGRLCGKGRALGETLSLAERLLYPQLHGARVDWNTALDALAQGLRETRERHGPDAVAFYVSGQLLTEDYYVANKLMKGFIGSANIDTNSRLCMAAAVAGQTRAFGEDVVPVRYADLEQADLVLIVGANPAWCHPVLYQRLMQARAARGTQIVVIDPRRTASAQDCDQHLALRPGTDGVLFNGLLSWLHAQGATDAAYIAAHTAGFDAALAAARASAPDLRTVAQATGLSPQAVRAFYARYAAHPRTVTLYSQGINQSGAGADRVNAIINCHLATGRIGRDGAGPFSITGQPNAMGGREVGGLANQLAGHRGFDAAARAEVRRVWRAPQVAERAGLKAVELFQAVEQGRVRALWILGTNPLVSMPDSAQVRRALRSCPFVAVSEVSRRSELLGYADVALPALAWGEKDGTVTNSERCISRQRAFIPAPGEARADWWALARVAQRMGYQQPFAYTTPAQIFREHARLSGGTDRVFDLRGLARLDDAAYDALAPVRWPVTRAGGAPEPFRDGRFATADGRARFVAVAEAPPPPRRGAYVLNTGRTRDHWHTMTRTALAPRLCAHAPEPRLSVHPQDAARAGLAEGDLARVRGGAGEAVARVQLSEDVARGSLFLPMHWHAPWGNLGGANAAVPAQVDPVSGQPALKQARVRLARVAVQWHGFALCVEPPAPGDTLWWSATRLARGWRYELAGGAPPLVQSWIAPHAAQRWLNYRDARGERWLCLREGRVHAVVCVAARWADLPPRASLAQLLGTDVADGVQALRLLGEQDPRRAGALVCSCANVHEGAVTAAMDAGAVDLAGLAERVGAGAGCGTCRPELAALLRARAATGT